MITSHEEIKQMIQTGKETIKEDNISEEVEARKHLVDTVGERGNISPQKIAQHGKKDVESVERRTTLQRFSSKKQCNFTFTLLQDGNPKLQESKSKLQMYDGSVMIPYGVIDIKCEVNQVKTKLQFQVVDTKNDLLISASASLALNLVTLNEGKYQVNDEMHDIKITIRKTNGDLLSKKKILEEYGDVFDTLGCVPGELHLEVDKSIRLVQHVPQKIPVAMKEEIIDELIEQKIVANVNEPTDWISSMVVVKKPQSNKLRICIDACDLNQVLQRHRY